MAVSLRTQFANSLLQLRKHYDFAAALSHKISANTVITY
jgi:hypothetical protein